jgi:hypothetical protein
MQGLGSLGKIFMKVIVLRVIKRKKVKTEITTLILSIECVNTWWT